MHPSCACRVAEEEPKTEADRVVRWEHDLFVHEEQGPRSEEEKKKVRTRGEVVNHSMFVPLGEASSPGTRTQIYMCNTLSQVPGQRWSRFLL